MCAVSFASVEIERLRRSHNDVLILVLKRSLIKATFKRLDRIGLQIKCYSRGELVTPSALHKGSGVCRPTSEIGLNAKVEIKVQ